MVVNSVILNKFGWTEGQYYSWRSGLSFSDIHLSEIKFHYLDDFFIIYKNDVHYFIIIKNKKKKKEIELLSCEKYKFSSNSELFKIIIKYEAFNADYQRHFKINKILNK